MRKATAKLAVIVMTALIVLVAFKTNIWAGLSVDESKSLISINRDSLLEEMVVHHEHGIIIAKPQEDKTILPANNRTILDIPTNDDCDNAQAVSEVQNLEFDSQGATVDGGLFSIYPNVWFIYTASTTDRMKVSIDDPSYSSSQGVLAVYDGVACPGPDNIPQPVELQGGDDIETATSITDALPVSYTGNLDDFERDYNDCSCMRYLAGASGPDVVYSYTPDSDDSINLLLQSENFTGVLVILDGQGDELICSRFDRYRDEENDLEGPGIFNLPVVSGETYYIIVSAWQTGTLDGLDYTLMIYSPDYVTIGRQFTEYYYAGLTFDAIAGHQYLIEVGYCPEAESTSFLTIEPAPEPPVNDACENATDGGILVPGIDIQFTGDNTGAGIECPMAEEYPDVWVKFTIQDTLNVRLDYCGSPSYGSLVMSSLLTDACPCNPHDWYSIDDYLMDYCPNFTFVLWWNDLLPGTYYYRVLINHRMEGSYVINLSGMKTQQCAEDALYGNNPTEIMSSDWEFYMSDFEAGYGVADKFEGIDSEINELTWWGMAGNPSNGDVCVPTDPYPMQIIFCNYNDDSAYLPGDTATICTVSVSSVTTGYTWDDIPQYRFVAELPEPVELDRGWIMIRGNDGNNNCSFSWQQGDISDGNAVQYDAIENSWTRTDCSMAFCLGPGQVGIDGEIVELPREVALQQNYPNPFNATTSIQLSLTKTDKITLNVYDIGGRLIKQLYNGSLDAGIHSLTWDGISDSGKPVSSGIYFYRLKCSEGSFSKRMVLLK